MCAPLYKTVYRIHLTSYSSLQRKMRRSEGWDDGRSSVTAKTQRVSHEVEHVPPSGRQGRGTLDIMLTRTRATSRKRCAVPQSDEDTRMFGCYGWRQLLLLSQRVHWTVCGLCRGHTLRDVPGYRSPADVHVWTASTVWDYHVFVQQFRSEWSTVVWWPILPTVVWVAW